VAGAVLVIDDGSANPVARLTTGPDGAFSTQLPAGSYLLIPQPVEGLLGTARPISFMVAADQLAKDLRVEYDTGIR
jgi:hypothetical protein